MSQVFVSGALIAFGPYIGAVLIVILAGAVWASYWLISTGIERRIWWRVIVGAPIALYLIAVFASAVLFIR